MQPFNLGQFDREVGHLVLFVQARSKPVQPPKKPANAPFFLPTIAGLHSEPLFDPSAADEADLEESEQPSSSSRINRSAGEQLILPASICAQYQLYVSCCFVH